jgi:hypothetical protein
MSQITQYEFNARLKTPTRMPWVVYRFYNHETAVKCHERLTASASECTEIKSSQVQEPFVRVFLSGSRFLEIDTTGLYRLGSLTKHYGTGTRTENWFCKEEDVSKVLPILNKAQANESRRFSS